MNIVMFLAPFSLGLGLIAVAAFWWSLRAGQYEDPAGDAARILVDDPEETLRSIFEFLGLDPNRYDFDAARDLPVRGSSAFGRPSHRNTRRWVETRST